MAARASVVPMPVVNVRDVHVCVPQRLVLVPMAMWRIRSAQHRIVGTVDVLVMLVVHVHVLMLERLVHVFVFVPFAHV